MDHEGVIDFQKRVNERIWSDPRCKEDERGWVQPFANSQGWDELNQAIYALRCVLIWRNIDRQSRGPVMRDDGTIDRAELHRGMNAARIESDMRSFHFHIARSRRCDRPMIP